MVMSVSVTTRKPRPGEIDGKDYHFISREQFDQMVADGELLEYAEVFGNGYGTPLKPVQNWLAEGKDVLFDIDWQGTQQIHARMHDDLVRIFILPPSAEELRDTAGAPRPGYRFRGRQAHGRGFQRNQSLGRI